MCVWWISRRRNAWVSVHCIYMCSPGQLISHCCYPTAGHIFQLSQLMTSTGTTISATRGLAEIRKGLRTTPGGVATSLNRGSPETFPNWTESFLGRPFVCSGVPDMDTTIVLTHSDAVQSSTDWQTTDASCRGTGVWLGLLLLSAVKCRGPRNVW